MAGVRIGIDIGGTFIDLVLQRESGRLFTAKVLTRSRELVPAILAGLEGLMKDAEVAGSDVTEVIHATTLGSNAVLERRGSRTALLTTRGFRDVLHLQRSLRSSMYDVQLDKPRPVIRRSHIWEVTERRRADGSVLTPLAEQEVVDIARTLRERGFEAAAVAYLHSYVNPGHEVRTREILASEAPEVLVTISSDVSQQGREYERTNTAVVNAYLASVIGSYLHELESALPELGITAPLWVMQSSGGLAPVDRAAAMPVRMIESGPAAGALVSAHHGVLGGFRNVISFDMGGTSAKAGVIRDGKPATTRTFELERVDLRHGSGLPLDIPAIDLVEVGAGGGSIAAAHHGVLQVGPRSAGADPGPACYGRGGDRPTVTDANVVLGYLNPDRFAGGAFRLDVARAEAAIDGLARELGLERLRTAWGIHEVVNLEMERAVRLVSITRGLDPRDFALVAIGGAAPAHVGRLARALGVRRIIVPRAAGVGSAFGLLQAGESYEAARTAIVRLDEDHAQERITAILDRLESEARSVVGSAWGTDVSVTTKAGLRYVGQGYELEIPIDGADMSVSRLAETFHTHYMRAYGYREDQPVEGVTWFVTLSSALNGRQPTAPSASADSPADSARRTGERAAYFPETDVVRAAVVDRAALTPGMTFAGPAIVEEPHTSTVIQPGDQVEVDEQEALVIEVAA